MRHLPDSSVADWILAFAGMAVWRGEVSLEIGSKSYLTGLNGAAYND